MQHMSTESWKTNNGHAKLLAAVAILAMVICAFAAVMPATDATGSASETDSSIMSVAVGDAAATYYDSYTEAVSAVNSATGSSAVTVTILKDFEVALSSSTEKNAALWFTYTGEAITINGQGHTVSVSDTSAQANKNIIGFNKGVNATVNDLVLDGEGYSHHGVNIYGATVVLNDVTSQNNAASGVTVNGAGSNNTSSVTTSNIATSGNGWGGINVDNNGGTASLAVNGTPVIKDAPQIWSEAGTVTFAQGLDFVKSDVNGMTWYTQEVAVSGETITSSDIAAALDAQGTVILPAETTITPGLIPAIAPGETVIVPSDATFEDGASFTVADGGSIVFLGTKAADFTVTGGTGTTSVANFAGVTGNFTVTGGSVEVTGTIEDGAISGNGTADVLIHDTTITGEVSISGTGNVELNNVTLAAGATLTLGAGIDYSIMGTFTNNGTIVNNGIVDAPNTFTAGTALGDGLFRFTGNTTEPAGYTVKFWDNATGANCYSFNPDFVGAVTSTGMSGVWTSTAATNVQVTYTIENVAEVVISGPSSNASYNTTLSVTGVATTQTNGENQTTVIGASVTVNELLVDMTVTGAAALGDGLEIGNMITVNNSADLLVPADAEVTFITNDNEDTQNVVEQGKITNNGELWVYGMFLRNTDVTTNQCIDGSGTVYAVNTDAVRPYMANPTADNLKPLDNAEFVVDSIDDLRQAQNQNIDIVISASFTIPDGDQIDFTGKNVIFRNNAVITINGGASFNIVGSTFDKDNSDSSKIVAQAGSKLTIEDSMIFMVVDAQKNSSVDVNNQGVTYDGTTSDVKVGYGTTLVLSRSPVSTVEVYGTLSVEGTATIASGITLHVYQGGTLDVSGTLNVNGKVQFDAGSTGDISGTMTVSNSNGGAGITSSGDVTVSGTLTISASGNLVALDNYLTVDAGEFAIEGTLNMGGTLKGEIQDKGTIVFNGEVDTAATIKVYDGVTLTITSVTGGPLKISDEDIVEVPEAIAGSTFVSDGNEIVLNNVKGITVTETVTSGNYTDSNRNSYRYYVCDMTVSGTVSEKGAMTVQGSPGAVQIDADENTRTGKVFVNETLGIGKDAKLNVNGNELVVAGSISCVAENSSISVGAAGEITVTGTITFGPENDVKTIGGSNINAAYYTVLDAEAQTTAYYTGFDAAVAAIGTAYQNTVSVYGEVTANTTVSIASGTINMDRNSKLTIEDGVTVTLQAGAKINGTGATIAVKGTFTAMNYREDLRATVDADVIRTNEPSRTWTSLATAMDGAQPGDVITLAKDVTLTEDITIPAGVTVETSYKLDTDRYTMTVDGTFSADEDGSLVMSHEDGEVVANGVVVLNSIGTDTTGKTDVLYQIDGAHFTLIDGADVGYYVTNLAYAAENVDNGTITVIGNVSAQDVVFALGENESGLVIEVESRQAAPGAEEEPITVLSFNTMELNGAILTIDSLSKVTGTVNVPCGDGTVDAVFSLASVSGIEIEGDSTETATGTTYEAYVGNAEGQTFTGTLGVTAGTAMVGEFGLAVGGSNDAMFNVAAGATLVVPDETTVTANQIRNADRVVIDGTIEFDEGALAGTSMTVNGTMLVSEDLTTGTALNINGTLTVAAEKTLILNGKAVVDDGASVNGAIDIRTTGYIVAFPGADLTEAQIDWQIATGTSGAKTTAYYINGEVYATVYVDGAATSITLDAAIPADEIEMTGYGTVDGWYETQEDADAETPDIGTQNVGIYSEVYANAPVANKYGTMSQGSGITLYVDGKTIDNWYVGPGYFLTVGTHTVSWDIKSGYSGDEVTATFNGASVTNGGTIEVTADMGEFTLAVSGATPAQGTVSGGDSGDDGLGLTDYLLIILVVLIVIMAIMVAMRLMRS